MAAHIRDIHQAQPKTIYTIKALELHIQPPCRDNQYPLEKKSRVKQKKIALW